MTIEDYPVSYDELEPYYDRFEKLCGISGKAGNLRGQVVAGGRTVVVSGSAEGPEAAEARAAHSKTAPAPRISTWATPSTTTSNVHLPRSGLPPPVTTACR